MLKGIVDLHVHTSPDVRPRRFSDMELAQLARQVGAEGVVLKGHHYPTIERAQAAQVAVPGIRVMGGMVLNHASGGLEPMIVTRACEAGAKIIWMPTLDAANHRRHENKRGGIEIASGGSLLPVVAEILTIIARHDIALATGHLSPEEIRLVVPAAVAAGIRRIIINHPEHRVTGLSIQDQRELGHQGPIYFERCYAQPAGDGRYLSNLDANLAAIETLGPDSTVLASDSGQMESAPWDIAWQEILLHHSSGGLSVKDLDRMARINPRFLCGLAETALTPPASSKPAA